MARKTVVVLECDKCSNEGAPYIIEYTDGRKEFILCDKHNAQFERLRNADYGVWKETPKKRPRKRFEKVDL